MRCYDGEGFNESVFKREFWRKGRQEEQEKAMSVPVVEGKVRIVDDQRT